MPSLRSRIETAPPPLWLLALLLAWVVASAASLALSGAGFLHPESYSFLPHYLSGKPLLQLIYDNRVTDWDNYQARELGFMFDWIDCQFIAAGVERGHPHFFSISHYLLLLVAGLAFWRIATRHLHLSRLLSFALVLLLWTAPSVLLYTSFYRAAKIALFCATFLAVLAWCAARGGAWWRVVIFGVTAALLPMCDKQGLLFLGAGVVFLARNFFVQRTSAERRLLVAGLAALAFAWSYQRFLGPAITSHLVGYEVNRGYIAIPFAELVSNQRFLGTVVLGAPLLAFDSFRLPLGSLPAGLALLAAGWLAWQFPAEARPRWLSGRWMFAGLGLFITAVFAAMLMLFPLMLSSEHRRFFYPLPVSALWIIAAVAACAEYLRRRPARQRALEIAVAALVLSNVFALQEHRFVLRHGKYQPHVEQAARVRAALRPENLASSGMTRAQAAALLADAPYFRDAVPPALEQDRIYLALASRCVR